MEKHVEWIGALMAEAGLRGSLVSARQNDRYFGDAEVIYQVGSLLLRFVRDRGQNFLDIASANAPEEFHQFRDIETVMGWKAEVQNPAKESLEDIAKVVARLGALIPTLECAFDEQHSGATVAKIARVRDESMQRLFEMTSSNEPDSSK